MKIAIGIVVVLAVVGLIFGLIVYGTYTDLVKLSNDIKITKWSNIQAAEQRRLDTIPKFAQNAQFSFDFQLKLNKAHAEAREGVRTAGTDLDPGKLQKAANTAFGGLMIAVRAEATVEAKLDQLTELNAMIDSAERVILNERDEFNRAVGKYMNAKQMPLAAMFISMFGWGNRFPDIEAFRAESGAQKAPTYELKLK